VAGAFFLKSSCFGGIKMETDKTLQSSSRLFKDSHKKSYVILASIVVIVLGYFLLKHRFHFDLMEFSYNLFMLKYLPTLGNDVSYGLLFVIGILTSFHCIGMCGGIAMSQTISRRNTQNNGGKRVGEWLVPSAFYNIGRVLSYTMIGGVVAGLGQVLSFNGVFKGIIPILGGIFMIIMGINLLGIFPVLRKFSIPVPAFTAKKLMGKNNYAPVIVGMLTGLMPCGPLQIVQLYALSTKNVAVGALSMFVFSVGTLPALFIFGALNTFINKKHSDKILKLCAAFVVILGFVMISRGLALSGINLHFSHQEKFSADGISKIQGNIQTVTTNIKSGSYSPITVQKGIPLRWTIIAEKENLNQCNNAITIPKLNIIRKLSVGENVIEFTPQEEGQIIYTCWMGMIKSSITVVSDLSTISLEKNSLISIQDGENQSNCNMENAVKENADSSKCTDIGNEADCKMENNKSDKEYSNVENKVENQKGDKIAEETVTKADGAKERKIEVQNDTSTSVNKNIQVKVEVQTWEGYLIDKHCFGLMKPEKETRACLLMDECESSGYGIALKQIDGSYKLFLFDENGHRLAYELLKKAEKNTGFKISVKGILNQNMINVCELKGD
jgi:sulfite exporter TauE/SafE